MPDPFTTIYNELWTRVEATSEITDLVKPGNRIKLRSHDPIKQTISSASVPELLLVPTGGSEHALQVTSNQFELKPKFEWILTTGTYKVEETLFPLTWELLLLTARFRQTMGTVLFNGSPFIKQITVLVHDSGDVNATANRGLHGYVSLLSFDLLCRFPRSLLDS